MPAIVSSEGDVPLYAEAFGIASRQESRGDAPVEAAPGPGGGAPVAWWDVRGRGASAPS